MTRTKEGHNLMKVRCLTNHLIEYHLRTFFMLVFMNQKKIIFGSGLSALGGVIYSRLFRCKIIYNISGIRGDWKKKGLSIMKECESKIGHVSMFSKAYRLLTDYASLKFSDYLLVPSQNSKDAIVKKYPEIERKIILIAEGAYITNPKKLKIMPITFFKTDNSLFEPIKKDLLKTYPDMKIINIIPNTQIELHTREGIKIVKNKVQDIFYSSILVIGLPITEHHSTTVLEALLLKRPVLLSNVGWINEELQEFPEILIDRLDSALILSKIQGFLADNKELISVSLKASKKMCKKYDIKRSVKTIYSLFD